MHELVLPSMFRAFVFYFLIMFVIRFLGKREVGELSIADLIVLLIIADISVVSIENVELPMYIYVLAIFTLAMIQKTLSFLAMKNNFIRTLIDGNPSIIIVDGKLNVKEMRKQKYTVDDLISQTRDKGIPSLQDISYAILETSGDLSVFKRDDKNPLPIIISGKINKVNLNYHNKSYEWVEQQLKKRNLNVKDVYYAEVRDDKLSVFKCIDQ